ncbi:MAG: hypothetical protein IPH95_06405 [Candidatus Promineofilum sp.]|jgi:hypothetical protein|nr:hypothetical protein [Promineifilum sp.]
MRYLIGVAAALALALVACGGATADPPTAPPGPQQIVGATELLPFDATTFPAGDGPAVGGVCVASAVVPGAYRCELDGGGADEPCFALGGTRLVCGPNPVAGNYRALVSPSAALPAVAPPPPEDRLEFFVALRDGPTCAIRTGPEPVIVGGAAATFDCDAPYTYLTTLDKSGPTWRAMLSTLDPATGAASGTLMEVARAWVP